jgi:hypothetical protein
VAQALAAVAVVAALAFGGSLPVLAPAAVPGLAASTHPVAAHDLAADVAGGSRFEGLLHNWGFARGRERDFQGPSRRVDRVVSRTLAFDNESGASAYVAWIGAHPAALYGAGSSARRATSGPRTGFVIDAAACACHRASPTLLAVVAHRGRVTWLEANGGGVTRNVLLALLARAP